MEELERLGSMSQGKARRWTGSERVLSLCEPDTLREGDAAMAVNGCEGHLVDAQGKTLYHNASATDPPSMKVMCRPSSKQGVAVGKSSASYPLLRERLPSCQTFFDDIWALTRYLYFENG